MKDDTVQQFEIILYHCLDTLLIYVRNIILTLCNYKLIFVFYSQINLKNIHVILFHQVVDFGISEANVLLYYKGIQSIQHIIGVYIYILFI